MTLTELVKGIHRRIDELRGELPREFPIPLDGWMRLRKEIYPDSIPLSALIDHPNYLVRGIPVTVEGGHPALILQELSDMNKMLD